MRNYVYEFEQIYLKNKFFEDPEKMFEDCEANPRYYFYKLFKDFCQDVEIKTNLEVETVTAERLIYSERIGIITLQGFGFKLLNCCNHIYMLYDFEDHSTWYCFSSDKISLGDKKKIGPALFIADRPDNVQYYPTVMDKNRVAQFNFEFRFFMAKFINVGEAYLPPLVLNPKNKKLPSYVKEIVCEDGCQDKFWCDLRVVPAGKDYLVLCPKCLSFRVFVKE